MLLKPTFFYAKHQIKTRIIIIIITKLKSEMRQNELCFILPWNYESDGCYSEKSFSLICYFLKKESFFLLNNSIKTF